MTQLPATLPQSGGALAKQRVPAPPGGQLAAGLKGAGRDNAPGQDASREDVPQFMVPDRAPTPLPEMPVNAAKPTVQAVLPEIEQLPVDGLADGEMHAAVLTLPEPAILTEGADETDEATANPDRPVAVAHSTQPADRQDPPIGGQTPAGRLRSTMASLVTLAHQSRDAQATPVAHATVERAAGETPENSGRLDGQSQRLAGAGPDRTPGPSIGPAQLQSMMSARVDARRQPQSNPQADIKTAGARDVKMELTQAGRPEVKVTVVHQETHFGSAPLQDMQLAGGRPGRSGMIAQPGQPGQSAPAPASLTTSQPGPMRVLHLHLEPAELGGVVVKMNMKGEALTVQIQPQLPQTALMLRSDSATLNSILQAAGVLADNASVQILEPSSNSHTSGNGMLASNRDADQSGSAQRGNADAGEDQRTGTSEEQDDGRQGVQDGQGEPDLSGVRSELYL
ncbi:MAG: hypothetical protein HKN11_20510 [Rhizobiales bacterium]|nr:hypothetical protein [Hyphomicrobiales bacterium]